MPTVRVGGAFRIPAPAGGKDAAPATATAAADLAGLLVLQQVEDEPPRDRAARRHGQAVLAALSALQRALLATEPDSDALDRLASLLRAIPEPEDPRLRTLLDTVLLRAHVELARRGR